jgi:putative addiction module component (TIGR02574 family)
MVTEEEILTMTTAEKVELLDILWNSFEKENYADDDDAEDSKELQLLQERLQDYRSNPSAGIKWEQLKEELLKRHHE